MADGKSWEVDWKQRIDGFAAAVGKTSDEIEEALKSVVEEPGEAALKLLSSEEFCPLEDLRKALVEDGPKIKIGMLRMNLEILRGPKPTEEPVNAVALLGQGILPHAPEIMDLMTQLQTGGISYFTRDDVIAAIIACVFDAVGFYEAPGRLSELINSQATRSKKPCSEAFYEVDDILTETRYGELFARMSRKPNQKFYSKTRKAEFLARASGLLWSALDSYYADLAAWQIQYNQAVQLAAPLMMTKLATGDKSGGGGIMYPDTTPLRAAVGRFNDMFNMMFCGTGVIACKALFWDGGRIMNVIAKDGLPELCGVTSKEELLEKLEIGVSIDFPIKINQIVTFALGIMELEKIPQGCTQEYDYLNNLAQVGSYIPFKKYESGDMIPKNPNSIWNRKGSAANKGVGLLESGEHEKY